MCKTNSNSTNIDVIEHKIKDYEEQDEQALETSLTLAAEAGSALLCENQKLKQELQNMKSYNADLANKITELNTKNNTYFQQQIEELENDKSLLISRNKALTETLQEVEVQLGKENQLRLELTATFEYYDKEKEELVTKLEGQKPNKRQTSYGALV
ncbi:hypothetical protein J6590_087909 [Homalodisca vitripennis]|nr:hypothetical protein J6590_087909 [Homalodisca vitripennis]